MEPTQCERQTFLSVTTVVLAFLIVAHSRTVGLTTGSPLQNTMSIYDLDVGHPNMKNLPVQEIPLPLRWGREWTVITVIALRDLTADLSQTIDGPCDDARRL